MAGGEEEHASLKDGESVKGGVEVGNPGTITEDPTLGWTPDHVDCEGESGLVINDITGGISLDCTGASEAVVTYTFINVPVVSNIPILSEWGIIAAELMIISIFFAVRKRRTDAA
jgi:hypothetical protein